MQSSHYPSDPILSEIKELVLNYGGNPDNLAGDLTIQMIYTALKFMKEENNLGKLKLVTKAFKEIRHAYKVFNQYPNIKFISIFGSARTPIGHPDYTAAEKLGALMAQEKWMCLTGAAHGIMHAGMQGAKKSSSFGLSIKLPFEDVSNELISKDPKLMVFRYFFTRKLMFISHSHAIAAFPGGFGTLDELFEVLTLMQTGKSEIIPVVLVEGAGGNYWKNWKQYIDQHLESNGWISPYDDNFFYITHSAEEAKNHILQFYKVYHSSRFVNDLFVIRLQKNLDAEQLALLNNRYKELIVSGTIEPSSALPEESNHLELPRIIFYFNRKNMGLLRAMIDTINTF